MKETEVFYDSMRFGELLRKKRRSLGLDQTEFGEIIGKNQKTISRWENGETSPPFEEARKILDLLGFDLKVPVYEGEKAESQKAVLDKIVDDYNRYGITPIAI